EEAVPRKVTLRRWGSRSYIYWYHKVDRSPELGLSGTETAIEDKDFACVSQHLRSRDIVLMATISGTDFRIEKLNSHEIQFHLPPGKNSEFTVFITCLTTEDSANPVADCRKILSDARNAGFRRIREEHREDWSSFWGKSFIQLYDDYVENLWYLNLYHIGSSSKGKYPPRFINYSLWNWNKDCEQSVWYTVTAQIALQFYEHFNYKYDVKFLKEKCFPVLEGAVRLYLSVFKEGDDSLYHIAKSMGYETSFFTSDTSVDLVHGRELFNAYIDSANYMEVNKEILGKCRRVLNKLSALPTCIYKNREVAAVGHDLETGKPVHIGWTNPHKMKWVFGGSDISQAFPCSQTGLDQKGDRFFKITRNTLLIQKVNPENGGILPNMIALARMGLSDQLAEYMDTWVNAFQQFPNGFMYYSPIVWSKELDKKLVKFKVGRQDSYSGVEREAGFKDIRAFNLVRVVEDGKLTGEVVRMPKQPFAHFGFEPPSILATAVNEMLLQSHQWGIRVFPAYPENKDGRFELMARRGFRVVSEKTGGEIKYVFIESLQGLECRIINPWGGKMEIAIKDLSSATASDFVKDGDRITFKTVRGGKYLIFRKNA
ncbi:MAG: hypothetical protein NT118_15660, partial [Lentisphaerae bacterium]|nr:hypothetical protein [Lentisphaerota bacterium]